MAPDSRLPEGGAATRVEDEMTAEKIPSPEALTALIDHTSLKAFGGSADIEKLCAEAVQHGFGTVMVNPAELERCVRRLQGTRVRVGVTVAFPLGQNTPAVKDYETRDALARGADEVDMVINIRALQAGDLKSLRAEMDALVKACRERRALSKVILETCYLTDGEKRDACRMAKEAGVDFVKTSTGFGTGGATVADVRLMRAAVGPAMGVKASGGIRDLAAALAMLEAGANRLGTSSGVQIVSELRKRQGGEQG
jgi:deoxyribose-phosphate aldolase